MFRPIRNVFLSVLLSLSATAQTEAEAPTPSEQPPRDSYIGFSREALQEWHFIEKKIANLEDKPEQLLSELDAHLAKDLLPETQQIINVVKSQVLTEMIDEIFRTAETEREILKAKELVLKLVEMIPDEANHEAALREVDIRFAEPAVLLQQVMQARAEQSIAEEKASSPAMEAPTEAEEAAIEKLMADIDAMESREQQLEYLSAQRKNASPVMDNWLRSTMSEILIEKLNDIQDAGINSVEDILRTKAVFAEIIHYCSPEAEKKQALAKLEKEFADPEALLRMVKEQEETQEVTQDETQAELNVETAKTSPDDEASQITETAQATDDDIAEEVTEADFADGDDVAEEVSTEQPEAPAPTNEA